MSYSMNIFFRNLTVCKKCDIFDKMFDFKMFVHFDMTVILCKNPWIKDKSEFIFLFLQAWDCGILDC